MLFKLLDKLFGPDKVATLERRIFGSYRRYLRCPKGHYIWPNRDDDYAPEPVCGECGSEDLKPVIARQVRVESSATGQLIRTEWEGPQA